MRAHLAHGLLSYCSEFPGSNWVFDVLATEIEDTVVCLNGKANRIISGKDYYATLHAHPMVHGSLFKDSGYGMHVNDCFHCPATPRCSVTK